MLKVRGAKFKPVEMDLIPDGSLMHKAVKKLSGHPTVPVIYINGVKIGGLDELRIAASNGNLDNMIYDPSQTS